MRYSNVYFPKGSIVFLKRYAQVCNDLGYLYGRPLIIISNPVHIFDEAIVCLTGTKNHPGIKCSFFDRKTEKYVGNNEISTIFPYNIMTIHTSDIINCIGTLDPFIMKKVDKAIAFHLGLTDEIPEYMQGAYEQAFSVEYSNITPEDIRINEYSIASNVSKGMDVGKVMEYKERHHIGKTDEELNVDELGYEEVVKEASKEEKEEVDEEKNNVSRMDLQNFDFTDFFNHYCCIDADDGKVTLKELYDKYVLYATEHHLAIFSSKAFGMRITRWFLTKGITVVRKYSDNEKTIYYGISLKDTMNYPLTIDDLIDETEEDEEEIEKEIDEEEVPAEPEKMYEDDDPEEVKTWAQKREDCTPSPTDTDSYAYIITRYASPTAIAWKYHMSVEDADKMQHEFSQKAISLARGAIPKLNKGKLNIGNLSDSELVGISIIEERRLVKLNPKLRIKLNIKLNDLRARYKIDPFSKYWDEVTGVQSA